jgi:hypothetical protein
MLNVVMLIVVALVIVLFINFTTYKIINMKVKWYNYVMLVNKGHFGKAHFVRSNC